MGALFFALRGEGEEIKRDERDEKDKRDKREEADNGGARLLFCLFRL